ncbi:MAG: peptidoglycan DD-metalloendopeptidase family protein [Bacteroidales bacterium]|jgi:murein DD-endopeptidase MepM/ murein hydrolase activator NlpD|nr:peptidoglycan DD-metalloendopeptidase family protein [Bacteroidales bacterium]
MLKKYAYIILTLLLLVPLKGQAQFFGKRRNKEDIPISIKLDPRFPQVRDTIDLRYSTATGVTLDDIWSDFWLSTGYIPIFYLPDPFKNYSLDSENPSKEKDKNSAKRPQIIFSVTDFTKNTLKEIEEERNALINEEEEESDDEEDTDQPITELPEEYDIWSNTTINPYNVKLADMKDTVRIDVSGFCPPIERKYETSEFGPRWGRIHAGIDLKVFKGDTIRAAFDGVVRIRRYDGSGYGNFIVLRNDNGLETLYGHMSGFIADEGQRVKAGEPIGLGGSTGHSTGTHLHFELRYLGNAINPRDAIDFDTGPYAIKDNTLVLTKDNFRYQRLHFSRSGRHRNYGRSRSRRGSSVTIRKGDTLGALARRHHTTVAKLKRLNGIKGNNIRSGKKLRVR